MTNISELDLHINKLIKGSPLINQMFEAELLRLVETNDLKRFQDLLRLPGLVVCDQIVDQVKELIKLQHPAKKLSSEETHVLVEKKWNGRSPSLYGVWAFYPWSNRLVHILDKDEFIEVRTSRNQYKITPEERSILAQKKVGVIGLSVGQSVSVTMAMERICGELRLADFDALELTNLNRIRTGVQNLGLLKVYSVAREIAELDPFIKIRCFPKGLTEENMDDFFLKDGKLDLVVEESDGFDIKVLARYKARELQVPVIMEASDRCMVDVERFDLEPNRPILHGILDHLDVAKLKTLTTNEEKIPYMFDILGLKSTSAKLRASMLEMQQTVTTWPQLASAVTMGGGITADVSRRMLLNDFRGSGRYYVDIDELIGDKKVEQPISVPQNEINAERLLAQFLETKITVLPSVNIKSHIETLVNAIKLAPSFLNEQQCVWTEKDNNLFLLSEQHSNVLDPNSNYQFLAFGAAIENLSQAALSLGLEMNCNLYPSAANATIVAQFGFENLPQPKDHFAELITKRFTGRGLAEKFQIPNHILDELYKVNSNKHEKCHFITDSTVIADLSEHLGIAERIHILHPELHAAFFKNVINVDPHEKSALDLHDLQLPTAMATAYTVAADPSVAKQLRTWGKGYAFENYYKSNFSQSTALGAICLNVKSKQNLLEAGRTLEQLWLIAARNNLAFQPICVSLTLMNYLQQTTSGSFSPFSVVEKEQIKNLSEKLDLAFGNSVSSDCVCLFRIFVSKTPAPDSAPSKRKSISKLFLQSHNITL